jgi:N-acyl-D-amino-acid deacylase
MHGKDADETALDLIIRDKSSVAAIYFLISEDNISRMLKLPYVSFGSDAASMSDAEVFSEWGTHPRAYGTFARFLGKYVREQKIVTLDEAIRRLTWLPATNLKIKKRGKLDIGNYADLVVFNADSVQDLATFEDPKVYAKGMVHVFINGVQVLQNGEHTGEKPGRVVRGPGWKLNAIRH